MSDPNKEINSTSITCPQVYTHPSQVPPDPRWQRIVELIAKWKVERDAKCDLCSKGWDLGRHGCHYEPVPEGVKVEDDYESAQGNCKAWPLSRRIQLLEEALR